MKRTILASLVALAAMAAPAAAQSFDCDSARRSDERTICESGELSRMDRQLDRLYRDATRQVRNPARLRARQFMWLSERRTCRDDERCLRRSYARRIGELQRLAY
jgi:uncharacterized protein